MSSHTNSSSSLEVNESLLTCTFSIIVAVISVLGHVCIGFYYWIKTGTFPLREQLKTEIDQLNEARELRHLRHHQQQQQQQQEEEEEKTIPTA